MAKGYFFSKQDVSFKINHNIITKLKTFRIIIMEQFLDSCESPWFYFFFIKYLIDSRLCYSNSKTNFEMLLKHLQRQQQFLLFSLLINGMHYGHQLVVGIELKVSH